LQAIEATGSERNISHEALEDRLRKACDAKEVAPVVVTTPEKNADIAVSASEIPRAAVTTDKESVSIANSASDSTIRVDVGLLDRLMNLVGELVLSRNQILQFSSSLEHSSLNASSQRLDLITTELQENVMKTRMQPIGVIWNKLPRVVRDMAAAANKMIAVEMDGAETELDKTIIEGIKDPLTHLVRNSCDHGIEAPSARAALGKPAQGKISLRAYHEGGQVNIEVSDDGAGIDPRRLRDTAIAKGLLRPDQADRMSERELLDLIFLPGFSTAERVTNISGRGVGMDVVKTNIEKIGGTVDLASQPGQGTTFRVKIPLTLAIIPGLVVTSGGERFVIPQASLLELIGLDSGASAAIENVHGTGVYRHRGKLLPIVYLNEVLGVKAHQREATNIVVLQAEDCQFGLVLDGVNDTQEIVVKPLGKHLKDMNCYAGSTIMGDGKVALILDVVGIAHGAHVVKEAREQARNEVAASVAATEQHRLLLFHSGTFSRIAVPLSLVGRLEEFPRHVIERSGNRVVVQYRGQLLQLASLSRVLGCGSEEEAFDRDLVQAIVFADGDRQVGIVVDEILDIVEDTIAIKSAANQHGFLGSAVIAGQVADFLDVYTVIREADPDWAQPQSAAVQPARVLLADDSEFSRGLVGNYLELAGHHVLHAADADHALGILRHEKVDVVAASVHPRSDHGDLFLRISNEADAKSIPVLALADSDDDEDVDASRKRECKFDRAAVLRSLKLLSTQTMCTSVRP
jgi:two-component system chemotaxis sensor kinase CheA